MTVTTDWIPQQAVLPNPGSETHLMEKNKVQEMSVGRKAVIQWSKNEEEGALLTNQILNSKTVEEHNIGQER